LMIQLNLAIFFTRAYTTLFDVNIERALMSLCGDERRTPAEHCSGAVAYTGYPPQ
jgi:hypothetical protein